MAPQTNYSGAATTRRTNVSNENRFEREMDRVQQYLCSHVSTDEAYLLGVYDNRSRHYYAEIQQFLIRKQQFEKARDAFQLAAPTVAKRSSTGHSDGRVLLQNLDEYLNELDPSLFESRTTSFTSEQVRSQAPTFQRSSSYIKRMQEAHMWQNTRASDTHDSNHNDGVSMFNRY